MGPALLLVVVGGNMLIDSVVGILIVVVVVVVVVLMARVVVVEVVGAMARIVVFVCRLVSAAVVFMRSVREIDFAAVEMLFALPAAGLSIKVEVAFPDRLVGTLVLLPTDVSASVTLTAVVSMTISLRPNSFVLFTGGTSYRKTLLLLTEVVF